jgi:hypothetical protein
LTDQPIQPRGFQPKDLKNTLGRRPTAAQPPPVVAVPTTTQPSPKTEPEASTRPAATAEPDAAREPQSDRPRRRPHTVFYLPLDLSKELRELARSRNMTNADVIFDALESTLEELPELLKPPAGGERGMFTRTPTKPVGQKVQISGRIQEDNLAIIDRLVDQHGAESRSQLIEVALRAYLSAQSSAPAR